MSELRSREQRKADALAALARNGDAWLSTASQEGRPHLIAVSSWWDGKNIVIATTGGSRTARNLAATGLGRLAIGSPADAFMVDVRADQGLPVEADPDLAAGFASGVGWNPAEVGPGWKFFRLQPVRIQAYRGYEELSGRDVMSDSRWLA
jgi:hypothetical protein